MRHLFVVALAFAPCLLSSVAAHAETDQPTALAATAEPAPKPSYLAASLGFVKMSGAAGPAVTAEFGLGAGSLPFGVHVAFTGAAVTTGIIFGASGSAQEARMGLELHSCGGAACAYVGVDVGEASMKVTSHGGWLSDEGYSHSGTVVVPRGALEFGRHTVRVRATMEAALGDVPGADGTLGVAAHW